MIATPRATERRGSLSGSLLRLTANLLLVGALALAARDFRHLALGVAATGTVQDRTVERTPGGTVHALYILFRDLEGVDRVARIDALRSEYDALPPPATCEVVYLPGDPGRVRLAGSSGLFIPVFMLALAALLHFTARAATLHPDPPQDRAAENPRA